MVMRFSPRPKLAALCGVCLLALGTPASARADDFELEGVAFFTNIQNGLFGDEVVPYLGVGKSELIGNNVQTGGIRRTSELTPVNETTLKFTGEVGEHPLLPWGPKVHVIATADGLIYCKWTAVFTIQFVSETEVVFGGDGEFTVLGGTGKYARATGTFRTLFATDPIPLTSDTAFADVTQSGGIDGIKKRR
jgi:hypothetical protein